MGLGFWFVVWFMMMLAFTTAWTFIVKGCETLDGEQHDEHLTSH